MSNTILGLKMGFTDHKVAPWQQKYTNLAKTSKIAQKPLSALMGDPTAVILLINPSIFIKWPYVRFLG